MTYHQSGGTDDWRAAILERKHASGQVDDDLLLRNADDEPISTSDTKALAVAQG